ncbi:MAG TPA: GNAT family N-acetyltransferase [Thermoanaerobaculia bacterium]|nr:GNAT family N-acetyltransferase [Thermoanaerobaculia bacterium]
MNEPDFLDDEIVVRSVALGDLEAIVHIDARNVGRRRDEFLKLQLKRACADTGIGISLAAELDGAVVGFLLARLYYGEFGVTEKVAVMDVLGVHPDFQGRHVGARLIDQLRTNLCGLGIKTLQTEVRWSDTDLMAFFHHEGFTLAQRLCLDLDLERTRP